MPLTPPKFAAPEVNAKVGVFNTPLELSVIVPPLIVVVPLTLSVSDNVVVPTKQFNVGIVFPKPVMEPDAFEVAVKPVYVPPDDNIKLVKVKFTFVGVPV